MDTITENIKEAEDIKAVKAGTATEEQENKVDYTICPCCGKPTLVRPVNVKGALLDHYMSCILSGVPFSHTYKVYGGKLLITVSQLSREDIIGLKNCVNTLEACIVKAKEKESIIKEVIALIRMYSAIQEIEIKTSDDEHVYRPQDVVKDICKRIVDKRLDILAGAMTEADIDSFISSIYSIICSTETVSATPSMVLMSTIEVHNNIYSILLNSGFDSNFWEGIELA